VLDFSIVNVALLRRARAAHGPGRVQWIATGYAISFGGLLILGGRAADLFGRRRSSLSGSSRSRWPAWRRAGRGPACCSPARVIQARVPRSSLPRAALITTSFPEARSARAHRPVRRVASVGFVAGQVLGGVLVQFTSWRAVFPGQRPGRPGRRA